MGAEIIAAKGRTHYGIATCVCYLADSILNQRPTIVSVTSPMPYETDAPEYALSVPSLVGPAGVHQRVRDQWKEEEYQQFVTARQKMIEVIKSLRE
jgi:L-lactate dehydrogenase